MMERIQIVHYDDSMRDAWMRAHAIIMAYSHAWNYTIQERPAYPNHRSTRLVALVDNVLAGLIDVQYENHPGELCYLKDSPGGYVLEFGRLPEFAGRGLGVQLMRAAAADACRLGFYRLEYWTQDRIAQRFYRRLGLPEIARHYRFRMRPPAELSRQFQEQGIAVEYLYAACLPENWPMVQSGCEIIHDHPLEPHLCIGFRQDIPEHGNWTPPASR
ncbi:MAG TPA: GNAT family N-acetyltransferase [Candidatus Hydrogenedentes bacterium]|nr:GNAT family N-acetyltransferase [Candidatus Hydrogenedentota bacterium]HPU98445.1 GNAT family N-acetyltransferase [Candidatus Hydrogenedentota bacterium]